MILFYFCFSTLWKFKPTENFGNFIFILVRISTGQHQFDQIDSANECASGANANTSVKLWIFRRETENESDIKIYRFPEKQLFFRFPNCVSHVTASKYKSKQQQKLCLIRINSVLENWAKFRRFERILSNKQTTAANTYTRQLIQTHKHTHTHWSTNTT